MATRAYILIETTVGMTRDVSTALRSLPGAKSVDSVTGPYDLIAVVEAADLNELGDLITERVHTVRGVTRTLTCLAIGSS
jgi:DNA-binding Lrp family transcriptional regulator